MSTYQRGTPKRYLNAHPFNLFFTTTTQVTASATSISLTAASLSLCSVVICGIAR